MRLHAAPHGAQLPGLVPSHAPCGSAATLAARSSPPLSGTWAGQAAAQALGQISRSSRRGSLRTPPPPVLKTITARLPS